MANDQLPAFWPWLRLAMTSGHWSRPTGHQVEETRICEALPTVFKILNLVISSVLKIEVLIHTLKA
jgi:hypothetical protein